MPKQSTRLTWFTTVWNQFLWWGRKQLKIIWNHYEDFLYWELHSQQQSALQRGISHLLASSALKVTQKLLFLSFLCLKFPIYHFVCTFQFLWLGWVLAFLSTNTLPKQRNMLTPFTGHKLHKFELYFLEGEKIHEIPFLFPFNLKRIKINIQLDFKK